MKFVTYLDGKKERVGVLNEDETWVYPLRAFGMPYESMQEVVEKMSRRYTVRFRSRMWFS